MPIILITGLPRHGKSIHAIRMMYEESIKPPETRKKIYATNFPELDYASLKAEPFDANKWMECDAGENGAILFFDEVWEFFEARSGHKMVPEAVKELARHAHYGFDMVMVTQGPQQIDNHVKSLVETHLHVVRHSGFSHYWVRPFEGIEPYPNNKHAKKQTADTIKRYKYDKKYFDFYKSAAMHTVKRRIPLKLIGAVIVILIAIGVLINMVMWGIGFMNKTVDENPLVDGIGAIGNAAIGDALPTGRIMDAEELRSEYYDSNIPLVDGAPWTAPKYIEVMQPVTFPKPFCAIAVESDFCFCLSQQGTKMHVEDLICRDIAINGFFDPTIDDNEMFQPSQSPHFQETRYYPRKPEALVNAEKIKSSVVSPGTPSRPVFTNWTPEQRSLQSASERKRK